MAINPVRLLRRWRAFRADVREEVNFLIERYGEGALAHVKAQLGRADLPHEQKRKLLAAAERLRR